MQKKEKKSAVYTVRCEVRVSYIRVLKIFIFCLFWSSFCTVILLNVYSGSVRTSKCTVAEFSNSKHMSNGFCVASKHALPCTINPHNTCPARVLLVQNTNNGEFSVAHWHTHEKNTHSHQQ